jgi:uncharacterized protein (TIGR00369 family)
MENYCFACGQNNPYGLKLKIDVDPSGKSYVEFTPKREYEGYPGIMHGGITSTILDEIMVYACKAYNEDVVTAKIEVRFLKPVPIGKKLIAKGKVLDKKGKAYITEGEVIGEDGTLLAKAKGTFFPIVLSSENL